MSGQIPEFINIVSDEVLHYFILILLLGLFTSTCGKDDKPGPKPPDSDTSGFAKGADVSWITEMEDSGIRFYDQSGNETECMALLKSLGMNSIRLRVWVNPVDGWCNKTDLLVKAKRAKDLGMRIMIDFHYSDVWADPGHQFKPAAGRIYHFLIFIWQFLITPLRFCRH